MFWRAALETLWSDPGLDQLLLSRSGPNQQSISAVRADVEKTFQQFSTWTNLSFWFREYNANFASQPLAGGRCRTIQHLGETLEAPTYRTGTPTCSHYL